MKKFLRKNIIILDFLLMPLVLLSGIVLKNARKIGFANLPISKYLLLKIGVFPIINQYYEPIFDFKGMEKKLTCLRKLNGINLYEEEQISFLKKLSFQDEIKNWPIEKTENHEFYLNNGAFCEGDSEYWYQIIRYLKPKRIIEIGSGFSTLIAIKALAKNKEEGFESELTCIEPYEMAWLERMNVNLIREKVENIDICFFKKLNKNDILFIDSSHIIRPGGDILYEYLNILPSLNKGVFVHIHDICTPYHYPLKWFNKDVRFWNEQYLLEAFLTNNSNWEIVGALNFLHKRHFNKIKIVAPFINKKDELGSFYLKKIK